MVDEQLVLRKIAELESRLAQIREFEHITLEAYRADWKVPAAVERTLQVMFELCVDVANHVIADRQLDVPSTYAGAFEVLGRAGLLAPDLTETMVRMAKFRNVLVHQYVDVDARIVVAVLNNRLDDFLRYRDAVLGMLQSGS